MTTKRGMYEARAPLTAAKDLEQGDIIDGFPLPALFGSEHIHVRKGPRCDLLEGSLPKHDDPSFKMVRLQIAPRPPGLLAVLSNSCDIAQGLPILVAPVRKFPFRGRLLPPDTLHGFVCDLLGNSEGSHVEKLKSAAKASMVDARELLAKVQKAVADGASLASRIDEFLQPFEPTDAEKWRQISEAATGTQSTRYFYLPELPGEFERSRVHFSEAYPLTHSYMDRCIKEVAARRVCSMTIEAQRHLQWAWATMFSRNPRDDYAWPSEDDLEKRLAWLDSEIAKGGPLREEKIEDRKRTLKLLGREEPEPIPEDAAAPAASTQEPAPS